jgi:hypothetical protein
MFDDDDDDEEDFERTEFEDWFDTYFMYFPVALRVTGYDDVEVQCFHSNVFCNVMRELTPQIRKLMERQYPIIKKEQRQSVLDELDLIAGTVGPHLLVRLYDLVYDDRVGANLREKYENFEGLIDFYARPDTPNTIEESFFDQFTWLTPEQKQQMIDDDRREAQEAFDWREGRKREFYDIVQPLLLKYYKEVFDLNYDGWIIYAVHIREEYQDYLMRCDHISTFIQFEFPEEDLHMPYKEFTEKLQVIWEARPDLRTCLVDEEEACSTRKPDGSSEGSDASSGSLAASAE